MSTFPVNGITQQAIIKACMTWCSTVEEPKTLDEANLKVWKEKKVEVVRKAHVYHISQTAFMVCMCAAEKMTDNGLKINLTFGETSKTSVLKAQGEKITHTHTHETHSHLFIRLCAVVMKAAKTV